MLQRLATTDDTQRARGTSVEPGATVPRSAHLGSEERRLLGGLLPFIDDPAARDVLVAVRGGIGAIWVDRGHGVEIVPGWGAAATTIDRLAIGLIAAGGRHLDELSPCADVSIGDGIRVHAVLAPVAASGTVISIRLPGVSSMSFAELTHAGLCSFGVQLFLENEVATKRNLLITGGTGSGKTTLLTALLGLVPSTERIITIEDVAELRPRHPHHIALESRQANIEGAGEISLDRLLRESLRMRPDRIVLGECRGPEIATLLAALNTGHDGGAGTLHANRIEDVPSRLEALGLLAGLPLQALARQVVSAFHTVVHVSRHGGLHRVTQLGRFTMSVTGGLEVEVHDVARALEPESG